MAKGIFVTGTDTGVGKTIVAATLARLLADRGLDVGVMKPVTSGCTLSGNERVSEDAELLRYGSFSADEPDLCAPYILEAPLAPSVAAAREGVTIDIGLIRNRYEELARRHDVVIVEGAGGLMVPLAGGLLVADLILALKLPVVVVARPNLGTVNHTVLTTFAARQMGIEVKGVIINGYPENPGEAEQYAAHVIGSLSGSPVLGVFPAIASDDPREIVDDLSAYLQQEPVTRIMIRELGFE